MSKFDQSIASVAPVEMNDAALPDIKKGTDMDQHDMHRVGKVQELRVRRELPAQIYRSLIKLTEELSSHLCAWFHRGAHVYMGSHFIVRPLTSLQCGNHY